MDRLLVLCNLHADGPSTWRRLCAHGVQRTSDLPSIPIERLAEWLGTSPASARRFVREAEFAARAQLPLDPNPRGFESTIAPVSRTTSTERAPLLVQAAPFQPRAFPLDEIAPRTSLPSTKIGPTTPRSTPTIAPRPSRALLHPGDAPTLDLTACEKLVAAGIRTWDELRRIPAVRIAAATGLHEAEIRAWQVSSSESVSRDEFVTEPIVELRPVARGALPRTTWSPDPARHDRELEDVAGPFA